MKWCEIPSASLPTSAQPHVICYYCTRRGRRMHISFSAKCLQKEQISNGYVGHEELHDPASKAGFRVEGPTHEAGNVANQLWLVDSICSRSHTDVFGGGNT